MDQHGAPPAASRLSRPGPLVTASWLRERLSEPRLRVVDCRHRLDDPQAGSRAYLRGHIPGAAFLDLDRDLSAAQGDGRHPLPAADAFGAAARRAGIHRGSLVVAYDDGMAGGAARLWWLLRHFGHDAAAVLAGGLAAWSGPLREGEEAIAPGDWQPGPRRADTVARDDVRAGLGQPGRVLVDARVPERFRGEVEPFDPVAGHIPGARNLPYTDAFPAPEELVSGVEEVVVYCGSGVTACVVLLALAAAGRDDAKLYPGSWSDWCSHELPVEVGDG